MSKSSSYSAVAPAWQLRVERPPRLGVLAEADDVIDREHLAEWRILMLARKLNGVALALLSLSYTYICDQVAVMFDCSEIGDILVLDADKKMQCLDPRHLPHSAGGSCH